MGKLENACAETESRAGEVVRAAKQVERVATRLKKAASLGHHGGVLGTTGELREAVTLLQGAAHVASNGWPFDEAALSAYLESSYKPELIEIAAANDVVIKEQDQQLLAYPLVIDVIPGQRHVRLGKSNHVELRPSFLVELIKRHQKKAGTKPAVFIEWLHKAYDFAATDKRVGARLVDVYEVLTLMPESRRSYTLAEFKRDVFLLDSSGAHTTKSGARVSFPAATGTKGSKGGYVFHPPNGMPKHYYGIKFEETR